MTEAAVVLALVAALVVIFGVRRRAWRQPRILLLIVGFVVVGVLMGALIALALGAVASASAIAVYVLAAAIAVFESVRWLRRRRG